MAARNCKSFMSSGPSVNLTAEEVTEHEKDLEELSELEQQFATVELDQRIGLLPEQLNRKR
jgi:hypothetical protein